MAGMAEAIPESNVGFKLLKQMGYDPAAAGADPVGIEIRRRRRSRRRRRKRRGRGSGRRTWWWS